MPQSPLLANVFIDDTTGARTAPKVDHATGAILTKPVAGSGEAVSIADGSDVAQGTTTDVAWVSGAGTVISVLKGIFAKLATLVTSAAGYTPKNYAANNAGDLIKTGAGIFGGLAINAGGTTSSATLYDGTTSGGTKLATIDTTAIGSLQYNIAFTTGLFIVLAGAAAADVTVAYK